jgi:hypothetical protein
MKKLLFLLLIPVFTNAQPPSQSRSSREIRDVFFEGNYVHYIINTVINTSLCQKIELGKPCPSAHIDFDEEEVFKLVGIPASFIDKEIFRNLYNAKSGMILLKSQNIEHRELAKADKFSVISYPVEYQRTYLVKNKKGLIGIKSESSLLTNADFILLCVFVSGIIFYSYKILRRKSGNQINHGNNQLYLLPFFIGLGYIACTCLFSTVYFYSTLYRSSLILLVISGLILRVIAVLLFKSNYPRIFALIELWILCGIGANISWPVYGIKSTFIFVVPILVLAMLRLLLSYRKGRIEDQGWVSNEFIFMNKLFS